MVLIKINSFFVIFLWLLLCCQGCGEPKKEIPVEFIIKSPLISISESDFLDELELKKAAYPYKITENPEEYNEMVISLVNMLSEEALLLSAAADLGIKAGEDEVKAAEDEFRKDYPEDGFDKMLLENAISYPLWKKRLKTHLIIDKLIDQEIRSKIEITSEELVEFYNQYMNDKSQDLKKKNKEPEKIIDENELVSVLRMQKTEDVYGEWLKKLESKYLIEIDEKKLKTLLIDIEANIGK